MLDEIKSLSDLKRIYGRSSVKGICLDMDDGRNSVYDDDRLANQLGRQKHRRVPLDSDDLDQNGASSGDDFEF